MATTAQITTEFIARSELFLAKEYLEILNLKEEGLDYLDRLYTLEDLFRFLIELQSLYNQWDERPILQYIDYWDNVFNLKSLVGLVPDPYRSYSDVAVISTIVNTLVIPSGVGLIYQSASGQLSFVENATILNNKYGLE